VGWRWDPSLLVSVVLGLAIGFAAGAAVFAIDSSRGLDAPGLAGIAHVIATAALFLGGAFAVIRILLYQDIRVAALLAAAIAGAHAGELVAFRLLPGDTTDGTMTLSFGRAGPQPDGQGSATQRVTCRWDGAHAAVLSLDGRSPVHPLGAPGGLIAAVALAPGGPPTATIRIDVLAPRTTAAVARYSGTAEVTLRDQSGRRGTLRATIDAVRLDPTGVDPGLLDAVRAQLPPRAGAGLDWDCPQAP